MKSTGQFYDDPASLSDFVDDRWTYLPTGIIIQKA